MVYFYRSGYFLFFFFFIRHRNVAEQEFNPKILPAGSCSAGPTGGTRSGRTPCGRVKGALLPNSSPSSSCPFFLLLLPILPPSSSYSFPFLPFSIPFFLLVPPLSYSYPFLSFLHPSLSSSPSSLSFLPMSPFSTSASLLVLPLPRYQFSFF